MLQSIFFKKNKPEWLGFSIIELLVVVSIISILFGVAMPSYLSSVQKSKVTSMIASAEIVKQEVFNQYLRNNGQFVAFSNSDQNISTNLVSSVVVSLFNSVNIIKINSVSGAIASGAVVTIALVPSASNTAGGSLNWTCKSNGYSQFCPSDCQAVCATGEC